MNPWRSSGVDSSADEFCENECPKDRPCEPGQRLCTDQYHPWGCPRQDVCVPKDQACPVSCPSGFLSCGGFVVSKYKVHLNGLMKTFCIYIGQSRKQKRWLLH